MVHHTYNPISIIAALLANSCHRLHSVLSHPHIRCNPHQPVPAGAPGWGSRMENSSLHWHSWETENSDFSKSEPLVKPPQLKTPLYHLCFLRAQGRDGCACPSPPLSPTPPLLSVCLRCSHSSQALHMHNYKNAQCGGTDVFHWSSIWNSTSHWESKVPVGFVLVARGQLENLCFCSQRTAG